MKRKITLFVILTLIISSISINLPIYAKTPTDIMQKITDKVMRYNTSSKVYTDVTTADNGTRYLNRYYYAFYDMPSGDMLKDISFSVQVEKAGDSKTNNTISCYIIPEGTDETDWAAYMKAYTSYAKQAAYTINSGSHKVQTWTLPSLTIPEGSTLVVYVPSADSVTIGFKGNAEYFPRITYGINESALLSKINSAETDEEIKALLTEYSQVIGIAGDRIELIEAKLSQFIAKDYESYEEICNEFNKLVDESVTWLEKSVNVTSEARQKFLGLGYTAYRKSYSSVPEEMRNQMFSEGIDGLNMRSMKMWIDMSAVITSEGEVDLSTFISGHKLESGGGEFEYAKKHGVREFILGPADEGIPEQVKLEGTNKIDPEKAELYGEYLADVVKALHDIDVPITIVSLMNENQCGMARAIDGDYAYIMARAIRGLHNRLKTYELTDVKIIAPERASVNSEVVNFYNHLKTKYPDEYEMLDMVVIHSYSMSLTHSFGTTCWNDGKPIINTESCIGGTSIANNYTNAATIAARALNDINNGVTLWTHFHNVGTGSDSTALIRCKSTPHSYDQTATYDYLKLISGGFIENTLIRKCTLDRKSISYTSTDTGKPYLQAAAGTTEDNEWVISIVNGTDTSRSADYYKQYHEVTYPDTFINVNLTVEELKDTTKDFILTRIDNGTVKTETVSVKNGAISFKLNPREIALLREVPQNASRVIYKNINSEKAYIRVQADKPVTGIYAEKCNEVLSKVKIYNFTEGLNVISEEVGDGVDKVEVLALDSIKELTPQMKKFSFGLAQ